MKVMNYRILMGLMIILYPIAAISELSEGILSAPKSLVGVKEFKWFIFNHSDLPINSNCEVKTDEIVNIMVSKAHRFKTPKIEINPDGGANDVFMFRIDIESIELENISNVCVLSINIELAYYDKIGFIPNTKFPPFNAKYVLWKAPQHLNTIVSDRSSNGALLGKKAAGWVNVVLDALITRIHAASKNGFKYMDFSMPVNK